MKIAILARLHDGGPDTPGRIPAAEEHQPQSLARALAGLRGVRYIARIRDDTDRRPRLMSLTEARRRALSPLELQVVHLGPRSWMR